MEYSKQIHVLSRAVVIDHEHLLLCKTTKYENNFYFLPGGHIEHNESAEKALVREMYEELGVHWCVDRFLGCLEYSFIPGNPDKCHTHEYNFFFELSNNTLSYDKPVVAQEAHIAFQWISLQKFEEIDLRPHPLKILLPQWLTSHFHAALATTMEG